MGQCPFTLCLRMDDLFASCFLKPAGLGRSLGQVVLQGPAEGPAPVGAPISSAFELF